MKFVIYDLRRLSQLFDVLWRTFINFESENVGLMQANPWSLYWFGLWSIPLNDSLLTAPLMSSSLTWYSIFLSTELTSSTLGSADDYVKSKLTKLSVSKNRPFEYCLYTNAYIWSNWNIVYYNSILSFSDFCGSSSCWEMYYQSDINSSSFSFTFLSYFTIGIMNLKSGEA